METQLEEDSGDADTFSTLHDQWVTGTSKKSQLLEEVGKWKRDLWTPKEVQILKSNVAQFLKRHKLDDPAAIIFGERNDLRSQFFHSIARNIQRPLFAIYRKVCRDFNAENYVHKWSDELTQQLLVQHSIHGNKWSVIGRALGVSPEATRDRYRFVANRERTGRWGPEEEDCLIAAMKQLHGEAVVKEVVVNSTSATWERVAELVKTRNAVQCRVKWMYSRVSGAESTKNRDHVELKQWSQQQDLDLLNRLSQQEAEDEEEVDWSALACDYDSVRSPHHLRIKWACLRRRVPGYALKSFQENLDYLVEHFIPILNRRLQN